jgi:hypothetical protein
MIARTFRVNGNQRYSWLKKPSIMVRQPDATMRPTPQDNQLIWKHRVLCFKPQRRHQPDLMAERRQFPSPMVGGRASLDADQAWRKVCEELQPLGPPQLASNTTVPTASTP